MIFILLFPFLLFAGEIEDTISKIYKQDYPSLQIEKIIIHNYKNQKINNIDTSNINTKRVSGTIKINKHSYIFYKLKAKIKVLKTTTYINKNNPINSANSKLALIQFKNFYSYPVMKYTNKVAKMYIPKNKTIYDYMLQTKNLITINQPINIISQSGGIEVTFQATALQNGKKGDYIKVKKDNKTFFVTIDKFGNGRL